MDAEVIAERSHPCGIRRPPRRASTCASKSTQVTMVRCAGHPERAAPRRSPGGRRRRGRPCPAGRRRSPGWRARRDGSHRRLAAPAPPARRGSAGPPPVPAGPGSRSHYRAGARGRGERSPPVAGALGVRPDAAPRLLGAPAPARGAEQLLAARALPGAAAGRVQVRRPPVARPGPTGQTTGIRRGERRRAPAADRRGGRGRRSAPPRSVRPTGAASGVAPRHPRADRRAMAPRRGSESAQRPAVGGAPAQRRPLHAPRGPGARPGQARDRRPLRIGHGARAQRQGAPPGKVPILVHSCRMHH